MPPHFTAFIWVFRTICFCSCSSWCTWYPVVLAMANWTKGWHLNWKQPPRAGWQPMHCPGMGALIIECTLFDGHYQSLYLRPTHSPSLNSDILWVPRISSCLGCTLPLLLTLLLHSPTCIPPHNTTSPFSAGATFSPYFPAGGSLHLLCQCPW